MHFRRFSIGSDPSAFGELASVAEVWQQRRRGGALPLAGEDGGVAQFLHCFSR